MVLAEDVNTKQTLRCDVIVDVIYNLQISTTTKELFMEEAPEYFEVSAYDDQGDCVNSNLQSKSEPLCFRKCFLFP